jgi:predicted nuclease of predicted toxin-antitoxin system
VSIRLLADADLNFNIVTGARLREPRIDFLSAVEAGLKGIGDPEVLAFAARQDRILVSHDMSTIPVHFARILHDGKKSPGVFLVSQDTAVREVIDVVVLIWLTSWPVEWENQIVHLPSLARHVFRR